MALGDRLVGLHLGLRGPRLPTTPCQHSTSSEGSLRVCASTTPPPSQTVSARLTAPCPDYVQQACRSPGWAPALQEEQLLGRLSGGSGGWALALRTDSASWDRGPGSPLKLGRKPALDWASEGPGHTTSNRADRNHCYFLGTWIQPCANSSVYL